MRKRWFCVLLTLSIFLTGAISVAKDAPRSKYILFVGTYTEKESKGIYAYRFDAASDQLTPLGLAAATTNPSFMAIDPSRRFLYAVNEVPKYKGKAGGAVSAFAIDRQTGGLSLLNETEERLVFKYNQLFGDPAALRGLIASFEATRPGLRVDTRLASAVLKNDVLLEEVLRRTPMRRYAMPEEIAGGAVYLASDAASYVTGHTLVIDGGMTI